MPSLIKTASATTTLARAGLGDGCSPHLLAGLPTPATVVADRGYDSNAVLDLIASSGAQPNIPS
jgi:hypothetical protein